MAMNVVFVCGSRVRTQWVVSLPLAFGLLASTIWLPDPVIPLRPLCSWWKGVERFSTLAEVILPWCSRVPLWCRWSALTVCATMITSRLTPKGPLTKLQVFRPTVVIVTLTPLRFETTIMGMLGPPCPIRPRTLTLLTWSLPS